MELNSKNIKKILFIIFCGGLIFFATQNFILVFAYIKKILSLFSPIVVALCIAFVLNVLLTPLETKVFKFMDKSRKKFVTKLKRPLCLVLTYLIGLGIVSVLILVIIPDIIETITYLAESLPRFLTDAQIWLTSILADFGVNLKNDKINWYSVAATIKSWISGSEAKIFGNAIDITTSLFSGIFNTIFSFVISIYVLAQKEKIGAFIKRMINAFLPSKASGLIYHISSKTYEYFSRFIGGQLTEALILGTLCFIGMLIFRFPNALIISVFIAVTSLVPIIGSTVGVIVGALLILITSPLKALFFVAYFLILQQIEGNLIYPRVVGKAVGLPGIIVISAVLVGGNIGGVTGTLIAVPTAAVLFTLLKELIEYMNNKKISHKS